MNDKLKQAIGKLEDIREVAKTYGVVTISEGDSRAIDTVVKELEKPLPTDENIKLFSEWCGKSFIRCEGGWWHRYNPQTLENIITTDTLLKWWNERNYTEKEATK